MDVSNDVEGGLIETPITDIRPITRERDEMIRTRDEIREFVEPPLVGPCEYLWDMNIRTLSSSANVNNVGEQAYIIVEYNSLSAENRRIAEDSGRILDTYGGGPAVKIEIPVDKTTTSEEIESQMNKIARLFQKQSANWIPTFSLQEVRQMYGMSPENEKYGIDDFVEGGFFYDDKNNKFYLSEEHFHKAKEKTV